jgi:hypothetical protein
MWILLIVWLALSAGLGIMAWLSQPDDSLGDDAYDLSRYRYQAWKSLLCWVGCGVFFILAVLTGWVAYGAWQQQEMVRQLMRLR